MANFEGILNSAIEAGNPEEGSLEVVLCGYGSQFPRASNGTLARVMQEVETDTEGAYDFTLCGNDVITPPGTYYTIAVKDSNGDIVQVNAYVVSDGSTYDLKDMVPFDPASPPPPLPPPIISQLQVISGGNDFVCLADAYLSFQLTMNQDATIEVRNASPGNLYTFIIIQDGTGNHLLTWPPYCINPTAINPAPNSITIQTFVVDSQNNLYSISGGTWYAP